MFAVTGFSNRGGVIDLTPCGFGGVVPGGYGWRGHGEDGLGFEGSTALTAVLGFLITFDWSYCWVDES